MVYPSICIEMRRSRCDAHGLIRLKKVKMSSRDRPDRRVSADAGDRCWLRRSNRQCAPGPDGCRACNPATCRRATQALEIAEGFLGLLPIPLTSSKDPACSADREELSKAAGLIHRYHSGRFAELADAEDAEKW